MKVAGEDDFEGTSTPRFMIIVAGYETSTLVAVWVFARLIKSASAFFLPMVKTMAAAAPPRRRTRRSN